VNLIARHFRMSKSPASRPPARPLQASLAVHLLSRAIMRSRFPGDTGVARYKHLALVMLILAEHKRGEPPTAGSLARSVGTHRSQVDLIVKALCERGLISKTAAPGYQGAQHNTILDISPDAIQAFKKAHLAQTGKRLDLEA
jgi:DNA-binding MarR family transcriptional regulator